MKKVFKTMAFTLLGLVLSVNLMAATSKVVYTETFEDNAFTTGTTYNNKDEVKHGPEGKQWGVICGTPVTGSHTGSKSFAMRYYKSVGSTPYLTQYFDIQGVDSLKFWAKTESTNNKLSIEYSTNGGTSWNALASGVAITTSYAEYKYEFETQLSSVRIRFSMGTSTEKKSMVIDDIAFVQKLSADAPSLSVSPETIDFGEVEKGATIEGEEVTVTMANIAEGVIAYFEKSGNSPFEIDNDELTESGTITITPKNATLAEVGEYSDILTITDVDELEKTVAVSIKVKEPAAPTGTFEKFSGDLVEGDYVICVGTDAMKNSVTSNRLDYAGVTVSSDKITNPDASVIWHIAPAAEGNWSIFNTAYDSNKGGYAAGTGTKNQAGILAATTDVSTETKAQWTCAKVTNGYNFENVANKAKEVNSKLQKNGTYGFACYAAFSDIVLYQKSNGKETVAKPTFSPTAGLYEEEQTITISCATDGASIYYTTDGTTPTASSTLYTGTFNLAENKTIKAIAVKEGMNNSSVASATYTFALPYTSLADFVSAAPTTESALVLDAADGVVIIGATSKNLYVQDATGTTMILFNNTAAPTWTVGKRIEGKLTGTYSLYNGMNEMVLVTWNNANADNDGTMPEPAVLTELTADNFATHKGKLIKVENVFFQATTLSNNQVIAKNASEKSFVIYNTFGAMSSKILPDIEDAADIIGVYIAYVDKSSKYTYELAATSIDAGDAKIDVDPVGGADVESALALAMNAQVTVTPVAGFTTTLNNNPITEATTITIDEAKSITVVSNRDFYTEKSVTYYYKVDESAKAVTVNQPEVGGTIAANPVSGVAGDIITLTYEAAAHYNFGSFSVMAGETPVTVSENAGVYTFEMPNANVTVSATFNIMSQYTATFVAGAQTATGSVDPIARYMDELEIQLPANGFAYAGHVFAGWSDGSTVKQPGENYTLAGDKEFTAIWEELPIWAYTYTSNVTIAAQATQSVKWDETSYDCVKTNKGESATVTVLANTTELHFHIAAWNGEGQTVTIKKGETTLTTIGVTADAGVANNSPYTLQNDPATTDYFSVTLSDIAEETTITIAGASGKRFVLFGVNAIQPASITIAPAEKNFGEVKQGFDAEQVFTLDPNAFATGTITAEIEGDEVFTASVVADNKVTVTFAPTEITDYSATLIIKHDGTQMCTATLTGKGISAETPEILVSDEEIDFGKEKQDASIADKTVTVTLNYLDAATASISEGAFTIDKTDLVAGENTITISATASSMGEKNATITITGEGATTKTIAVKMDVTSKYASEYNSNVEVGNDKVIIAKEEYEAVKKGTGSKSESTTITVPEKTQTLHFHAAAWNNENTILVVKQGETTLGSFNLYKDAGVKNNSPFTLSGNNYDTDQYFYVNVSDYTADGEAEITFTTTESPYRFVLYGVNQEGGLTKQLSSIEVSGTPNKLQYTEGNTFDPTGLTVMGTFKFGEETLSDREDVTAQVTEWVVDPATLASTTTSVSVVAKVGEIASEEYIVENVRVLPENTDIINASTGTATTSTYKEFTATGLTNTKYAGKTALNDGNLTLSNAASHPGIVSTYTIGYIKSVKVTIADDNTHNLDVYGSHRAYQSAEDLYSLKNAIRGTKIGTLTASGVLDLSEAETKYEFIGIRSEEGAIQVPEIQITWTPVEFLRISVAENIEGGTIDIDRTVATAEEVGNVQVTIEPTPNEGLQFDKLVIYNESDEDVTASITIAESGLSFTMPNYNVKVGATFKSQPVTAISLDKSAITVDKNNTETLTASFLPQGAFTEVTWTSANEAIAMVDEEGVVTGMGQGTTTITASCNDGALTATCTVTVNAQPEYVLVTDATSLQDGDVIVLGSAANNAANGGYISDKKYLDKVEATITDNVLTSNELMEITLCKTDAGWNLVTEQGHLGAKAAKNLLINDVYTDWTISISGNVATISAGDPGRFLYNVNSPRFLNYTSDISTTMLLPEIYRLSNDTKKVVKLMDKNNVYAIYRVREGENVTLSVALPSGCTKGWTMDGETYAQGATIENVTDDMVLYAIQSEDIINEDKEISSKDVNKGSTITIGDGTTATNVTITSETQETAQAYQIVVKKNATVTISTPSDISNLEVEVGGKVTVETTKKLTVNNFVIKSTMAGGESGQVLGVTEEYFEITGEAYYDLVLGDGGNPDKWHAFAVPFNVDAINGVYDLDDNKLTNEVNYAIMDYHGDVRADGQYGWKKFRGIMTPGTFYLMTVDGARTTYRMKMASTFEVASNEIAVSAYASSETADAGWNGIANSQLENVSVNAPVQILDPMDYVFKTKMASECDFTVGTPFFYQANGEEEGGKITLAAANSDNPAPAPRMTTEAKNIAVTFANESYTDRLYISATDEATDEYQIGRDLVKMTMTNTPVVPQIFAEAYGTKLSMIDVPMMYDEAVYALNLYAPANGEYTMGAAHVEGYEVFLTQYGSVIWNLSMSEATIELTKGNNTEYGLILKVASGHAPTNINTINGQESVQKFLYNSNIYIRHNNKTFNVQGQLVK